MFRIINLRVLTNVSRQLSKEITNRTKTNATVVRNFCSTVPKLQKAEVEVTFVRVSGERIKIKGKEGDSLLDVVVNNNIDLDGFGACEGTLTCSTCHLIFSKPDFDKLPDKPGDEELDMLDLAYDLTDESRLGCQIYLTKDMNGLEVKVSGPNPSKRMLLITFHRFLRRSTMQGRKIATSIHDGARFA